MLAMSMLRKSSNKYIRDYCVNKLVKLIGLHKLSNNLRKGNMNFTKLLIFN